MGCIGELPGIVLGGIATSSQAPDGTPGHLRGHAIEESPGERTARTIRQGEGGGVGGFAGEFEANRDAETVPGPTREGHAHHAQHQVYAPQWAICLPGGARAMAVAAESLDMGTSFFLGGIVEDDAQDNALGDKAGRQTDDGTPELPAFVVEGTTKEHIEP